MNFFVIETCENIWSVKVRVHQSNNRYVAPAIKKLSLKYANYVNQSCHQENLVTTS